MTPILRQPHEQRSTYNPCCLTRRSCVTPTQRKAFAKGRLKTYGKTERSRRRVPLRAKVLDALAELPRHDGIVVSASAAARINIDNFRSREWVPAIRAAGLRIVGSTKCATPSRRGASPPA
jgi:hypothetical protein